jgi:Matrixin
MRFGLFSALAAFGYAVFSTTTAHAYCLTRTCDPTSKTETCVFDGICNMSGHVLFWKSNEVSFDVQKDGSSETLPDGTKKLLISAETLDAVATTAFGKWLNADCGNGTHPSMRIKDLGLIDCAKPEYNSNQGNANVLTFHDTTWPYSNAAQDTLALTTVFFDADTGEIYDSNVEINSNQDSFAVGTLENGELSLSAVLTHELGHFLGLAHSSVGGATMFSMYDVGMDTLETDDVEAICASLPPDRVIDTKDLLDPAYTPRHGFSAECAKPDTGCCATAVGANASPSQTLGLWAFGLGLCAWRGRARLRRARARRRSARAPRQ